MAQLARKKPRLKLALTKRINTQCINSPSPSLSLPSPPQISSRTRTPASSSHIQISTASNSSQTNTQPQACRAQTSAYEQQERREQRKKRKYEEFVKEVAAEYKAEYKLILDSLMSHDIPLTADDLPMFLYDLHKLDSKNKWGGLLHGHLLILICHCILLGPGAAFAPPQHSA
ncbi:hypothetical protein F5050DRAFT_1813338 [Lentinula boryana]|uniref:Uncharacterized protein n=1 Tax=Lentinula boryana TaxID=40481 RepID=A0ABQ8PWS8_9AGAR|nr:hypothetical protein F5050DRAFT_1813338 [Lentinula boryana]